MGQSSLSSSPGNIWIGGFPRDLLASVLKRNAEFQLSKLSQAICAANPSVRAYNGNRSYSITFMDSALAKDCLQPCIDKPHEWEDPISI